MPTATEVLQSIGLANTYPESQHGSVYLCLSLCQLSGCYHTNLLSWTRAYLMSNSTVTIESFQAYIRGANKFVKTFSSYMFAAPEYLASSSYIERRLGMSVSAVLDAMECTKKIDMGFRSYDLIPDTPITTFIKDTLIAFDTVQLAHSLCVLDLISSNLLVGNKYKFMGVPCSRMQYSGRREQRAITMYIRACLDRGTDLVVSKEVLTKDRLCVWPGMSDAGPLETEQTRAFMLGIFAKHKLLFNYLSHTSYADLESLCNRHPDVALIMCGRTGELPSSDVRLTESLWSSVKRTGELSSSDVRLAEDQRDSARRTDLPPRTRSQKLNIACTWSGLLLLDLLQVDASTVPDVDTLPNLVVKNQPICVQSVCIEI